jgi:hypothetical protein
MNRGILVVCGDGEVSIDVGENLLVFLNGSCAGGGELNGG